MFKQKKKGKNHSKMNLSERDEIENAIKEKGKEKRRKQGR